jgi:hypothetical protein
VRADILALMVPSGTSVVYRLKTLMAFLEELMAGILKRIREKTV